MCCCPTHPNVNGTPGYRWSTPDGPTSIYPVNPPTIPDDEILIFDEPGRCGGVDTHAYHFRVARGYGSYRLYWRHGGGQGSARISNGLAVVAALSQLDTHARYWLLHALYYAHADAIRDATQHEAGRWRAAAADKRLKVSRRGGRTRVWIDPSQADQAAGALVGDQ